MPKLPDRYLNAAVIWDELCKELGIDPEHCKKITIEIVYGQPILVFPEMLIRRDAKVFKRESDEQDVGTAFNDFLPRCANCHEQLGEIAAKFCSSKCAEEYAASLK